MDAPFVIEFDGRVLDDILLAHLATFEAAARALDAPTRHDETLAAERLAACEVAAVAFGRRLADVALDAPMRDALAQTLASQRSAKLVIRVTDASPVAEEFLDLPWELISLADVTVPVRDGRIDIVREVAIGSTAWVGDPAQTLTVGISIAAPHGDDRQLRHEDEAAAIYDAVVSRGHRVAFADLGTLQDVVTIVRDHAPHVHHHVSHGIPGAFELEDDEGFPRVVTIEEIVRAMAPAGRPAVRLFFVGTCAGASAADRGTGRRMTAISLQAAGIPQVVAYRGLIADLAASAAASAFYGSLADGAPTTDAVRAARRAMREAADAPGGIHLAFSWAQLALYQRGPDTPLVATAPTRVSTPPSPRIERDLDGLPVLERGFIGRRGERHELRGRIRGGQRLIVLQGPSGSGKTALASHLLNAQLRRGSPPLVVPCRDASPTSGAEHFRLRAEAYGEAMKVDNWLAEVVRMRRDVPEAAGGFTELVTTLAAKFPALTICIDNAETLLVSPGTDDAAWHPDVAPVWHALRRLSTLVSIVITTRHAWTDLESRELYTLPAMRRLDMSRLFDTFTSLRRLPTASRHAILKEAEGTPRVLELIAAAIDLKLASGDSDADTVSHRVLHDIRQRVQRQHLDDLGFAAIWNNLDTATRDHATLLGALRAAAPREVVDALGLRRDVLQRASLILRDRVVGVDPARARSWTDRWLVDGRARQSLPLMPSGSSLTMDQHREVGLAYLAYISQSPATTTDFDETVHHLHLAREGDRAWTTTHHIATWLRDRGQRNDALELLERSADAGLSGEALAVNHALQQQMRVGLALPTTNSPHETTDGTTAFARGAAALHEGDFDRAYAEAERALTRDLSAHPSDPIAIAASRYAVAKLLMRRSDSEGIRKHRREIEAIRRSLPAEAHGYIEGLLISIDADQCLLADNLPGAVHHLRRLVEHSIAAQQTEQHGAVAVARLELAQALHLLIRRERRRVQRRMLTKEALTLARRTIRFYEGQRVSDTFEKSIAEGLLKELEALA